VTAAETAPDADEVERLRAALAVATRSLEATSSGERLTTCDELARLSREVATVTRERDAALADAAALRAAARAYLVAVDGWERSAHALGRLAAFVERDDARDALRAAIGGAS
jgi:hypothetical protein